MREKENPTQRSGWGKGVFKAHGLRSMGHLLVWILGRWLQIRYF